MNCNFDTMVAEADKMADANHSMRFLPEMEQERHFSEEQLRSIYNDICGDRVFTHITDVTHEPLVSTFSVYLGECQGENPVDAFAGMFEVSLAEAQGEYDKLRNHGCKI
jgi:hypothetical protein